MREPAPRPDPLPDKFLMQRRARESKWEINSRASEEDLQAALAWAKEALTNLFMAQDMGGNENDPQYLARLDDLYDTIRDSFTRQDLILGFVMLIQEEAQEESKKQKAAFDLELAQLTDPDIF